MRHKIWSRIDEIYLKIVKVVNGFLNHCGIKKTAKQKNISNFIQQKCWRKKNGRTLNMIIFKLNSFGRIGFLNKPLDDDGSINDKH